MVIVKMFLMVFRSLGVLGWLLGIEIVGKNLVENWCIGMCCIVRNCYILWCDVMLENVGVWKLLMKFFRDYVKGWWGRLNRNGCLKFVFFGLLLIILINFKWW